MEIVNHNNLTDSLRMAGRQTGSRAAYDKAGEASRGSMQGKQAGASHQELWGRQHAMGSSQTQVVCEEQLEGGWRDG